MQVLSFRRLKAGIASKTLKHRLSVRNLGERWDINGFNKQYVKTEVGDAGFKYCLSHVNPQMSIDKPRQLSTTSPLTSGVF